MPDDENDEHCLLVWFLDRLLWSCMDSVFRLRRISASVVDAGSIGIFDDVRINWELNSSGSIFFLLKIFFSIFQRNLEIVRFGF